MAGPLNFFLARTTFLFPASFFIVSKSKKIWTLKIFGTDTRYNEFVLDFNPNRVAAVVAVAAAVVVLLLLFLLLLMLLLLLLPLLAQRFKNSFQSV